jgi:hypothetical protein
VRLSYTEGPIDRPRTLFQRADTADAGVRSFRVRAGHCTHMPRSVRSETLAHAAERMAAQRSLMPLSGWRHRVRSCRCQHAVALMPAVSSGMVSRMSRVAGMAIVGIPILLFGGAGCGESPPAASQATTLVATSDPDTFVEVQSPAAKNQAWLHGSFTVCLEEGSAPGLVDTRGLQ